MVSTVKLTTNKFPEPIRAGFLHFSRQYLFPSRVSGRGYKISPVCLCICVCVCLSALSRLNRLRYGPKFGGGVYLDDISDKFEGQGHRSKIKVVMLKNTILKPSYCLAYVDSPS